jgi:hypothetical protein
VVTVGIFVIAKEIRTAATVTDAVLSRIRRSHEELLNVMFKMEAYNMLNDSVGIVMTSSMQNCL